jgi:hypothetical protein
MLVVSRANLTHPAINLHLLIDGIDGIEHEAQTDFQEKRHFIVCPCLLDLEHTKSGVSNSLEFSGPAEGCCHAIDEFADWYC